MPSISVRVFRECNQDIRYDVACTGSHIQLNRHAWRAQVWSGACSQVRMQLGGVATSDVVQHPTPESPRTGQAV